jgi:nicotinate-nucleotide adenylyltransferase
MKRPVHFESGTVVVFGGSFDPVTYTHIQIATEIINFGLADQVWIVPCGMRPDKHTNVDPHRRLEQVSIALNSMVPPDFPVFVESTEVDAGRFFPTRELMSKYRIRYPRLNFKVLIGDDLLTGLHTWDDFPHLIKENEFIVYDRGFNQSFEIHRRESVTLKDESRTVLHILRIRDSILSPAISNISSTEVRKRLLTKGIDAIVGLTPLEVIRYVEKHNLYPRVDSDKLV